MNRAECRPLVYLKRFGDAYPGIWNQFNYWRVNRGKKIPDTPFRLPPWPDWCFVPRGIPYALIHPEQGHRAPDANTIAILTGLAAWRATQGIYRFDETVLQSVWQTPVEGELPCDVLLRFPEWCVYVETPGKSSLFGGRLFGFFAYLDYSVVSQLKLLHLLLDEEENGLVPVAIDLTEESLPEVLRRVFNVPFKRDPSSGMLRPCQECQEPGPGQFTMIAKGEALSPNENITEIAERRLAPLVSLMLYLCATAAELRDSKGSSRRPANPEAVGGSKGGHYRAPSTPTVWEVAYRLGAALRIAQRDADGLGSSGSGNTHSSPRPHIRRAHWHAFWTGAKSHPEKRKLELKWLPPIPVNVETADGLVPVIRTVKGRQEHESPGSASEAGDEVPVMRRVGAREELEPELAPWTPDREETRFLQ